MFISNEEKKTIIQKIDGLTTQCENIAFEVMGLMAKVKKLEAPKPAKVKKPKKVMTPEQKAKQREYQRLYKARKKQEANNVAIVVELLKENNVSS
jgi:hypothetical protein